MKKEIRLADNARKEMYKGVELLFNCVAPTFGPGGRNVIIGGEFQQRSTKDGVSVAKTVNLLDAFQNTGAQIIKTAAEEANNNAGDGTTTSIILANEIIKQGMTKLDLNVNAVELKRGIDKAKDYVIDQLKLQKHDIKNAKQINQVATISSNNDEKIGQLITEAFDEVSMDGAVIIEESKQPDTFLEVVDGMQFDRGYLSQYFITNEQTMQVEHDNPIILIFDGKLTTASDGLQAVMTYAIKNDRPLFIIADDISGNALALLIVNKAKGLINVCAVKAPEYGDRKKHALQDIAILTDSVVISKDKNQSLDMLFSEKKKTQEQKKGIAKNFEIVLGSSRSITVTHKKTTIIDGNSNEEAIEARKEELKTQLDNATSPLEESRLQIRFSKLSGGIAILHVGAETEMERSETKDRVEDAVNATQSAIKEGILAGGGIPFMKIKSDFEITHPAEYIKLSAEQKVGFDILMNSLSAPFTQLCENLGENAVVNWSAIKSDVMSDDKHDTSYDLRKNKLGTLMDTGVIDPFKVTRVALEKSVSVAGTFLTTEVVINDDPNDKKEPQQQYMM